MTEYYEQMMRRALALAAESRAAGEVPVGALIVRQGNGEIISTGKNWRETGQNALHHAEIEAIHNACSALSSWRLLDCELFVTLEPCAMCAGAIINSRIRRVIFGAYDPKAGSCGSVVNLFDLPYNHKPELVGGVLQAECAEILSGFFKSLRNQ